MKQLCVRAYAKVNLALDVLRRREDGYHEVRMIMQNLDLYDELEFTVDEPENRQQDEVSDGSEAAEGKRITITANRDDIPTDDRNLIYKAVMLMLDTYGIDACIHVKLTKNIPVEAGMAGGSTDCAAALKAMNTLFSLKADERTLMELGVRLGADVPYCIMARTALSEGIGEKLTPVTPLSDCYVLVVKPPVRVSTGAVYGGLLADELKHHPDVDGMIDALAKKDVKRTAAYMENVLETVTVRLHPVIEDIKTAMKEQGALNAIMSGSGPTVFGIFTDEEKARRAAAHIREWGYSEEIYVTRPVSE